MNNLGLVFWQYTLPLMVTILVAVGGAVMAGWISDSNMSKRMDDLSSSVNKRLEESNASMIKRMDDLSSNITKRLDEIIARLGRIEDKVENHGDRILRLEERTSPILRR